MNTIEHVPLAPGGYHFKRATTTQKGDRTEAFFVLDFQLSFRHATESMTPLAHLQKSASICSFKAGDDKWQGNCSIEAFQMVPNKLRGEPSIMKGKINLHGTPSVLEAFALFMIAINKADIEEIDTCITSTQGELPSGGPGIPV